MWPRERHTNYLTSSKYVTHWFVFSVLNICCHLFGYFVYFGEKVKCDICVCAFEGTRFGLLESVSWILISLG